MGTAGWNSIRVRSGPLRWHLAHSVDIFGSVLLDEASLHGAAGTAAPAAGLPAIGIAVVDDALFGADSDDGGSSVRPSRPRSAVLRSLQPALTDAAEVLQIGVRTVPVYVFSLYDTAAPMLFDSNSTVALYVAGKEGKKEGRTEGRTERRKEGSKEGRKEGRNEAAAGAALRASRVHAHPSLSGRPLPSFLRYAHPVGWRGQGRRRRAGPAEWRRDRR